MTKKKKQYEFKISRGIIKTIQNHPYALKESPISKTTVFNNGTPGHAFMHKL